MIRRCLIVDTETTGLDREKDSVIEIGAILYSVEHHTSLIQFSTLQYAPTNAAEPINRIPVAALRDVRERYPLDLDDVLPRLLADADIVVAHRAEFDRGWFAGEWHAKPWVCTKFDFTWPRQTAEGQSLVPLALEHGIGVSHAHRALTDCQLIAALFDVMPFFGCDLQQMFAHAMRPKAVVRALVTYEDREKAKAAGFKWDGEKRHWTRRMALEDAKALPFHTEIVGEVA